MTDMAERLKRARTLAHVSEHRQILLEAIASHHARVANIATKMSQMVEAMRMSSGLAPMSEELELLEYQASMIDKSFIDAFGFSIIETIERLAESKNEPRVVPDGKGGFTNAVEFQYLTDDEKKLVIGAGHE